MNTNSIFCEVCYAGFVVTILETHDFKLAPTHTVETERERGSDLPQKKQAVHERNEQFESANKDTHTSTHPDGEEGVNAAKVHVSSCLPLCSARVHAGL